MSDMVYVICEDGIDAMGEAYYYDFHSEFGAFDTYEKAKEKLLAYAEEQLEAFQKRYGEQQYTDIGSYNDDDGGDITKKHWYIDSPNPEYGFQIDLYIEALPVH